jgi:hypothetical protein
VGWKVEVHTSLFLFLGFIGPTAQTGRKKNLLSRSREIQIADILRFFGFTRQVISDAHMPKTKIDGRFDLLRKPIHQTTQGV